MDYKIILLVISICAVIYIGFPHAKYYLSCLKVEIDVRVLLRRLQKLAKLVANDNQDILIDKAYDLLLHTFDYASDIVRIGRVELDELLDFSITLVEGVGFELTEKEEKALRKACTIMLEFIN